MFLDVRVGVREINFASVGVDIRERVENVRELIRGEVLRLEVPAVDGLIHIIEIFDK